jgi:hypothetical protein
LYSAVVVVVVHTKVGNQTISLGGPFSPQRKCDFVQRQQQRDSSTMWAITLWKQYKWPLGVTSSLLLLGTCCFHWRAKILSAYLSYQLGIPIRVQQCYFGKAWIKLVDIKVTAEQDLSSSSSVTPAEALYIPELRIDIEQHATEQVRRRLLHFQVLKPHINLVFQNIQMTDNNWRRLARLAKRPKKRSDEKSSSIQLGRIFLGKGASLSVYSCTLQQKLIQDIHLQEMYLDTNEFRSLDGLAGFVERISATKILEGNVLTMPPEAKQALKNYAKDIVKQRWDSTKVKLDETIDKWSKVLEDSTKSFDEMWQHHSNKYKQWKEKGISTLSVGDSWLSKLSLSRGNS